MWARICFAPSAQLMPTLSSGALGNGNPKGFDGLAGKRAAAQVNDGHRSQQGQAFSRVLEVLLGGKKRGFAVERVEDGFHQQQINAAVHEAANLLVVGVPQLIEGHGASSRTRDLLRRRGRAAGGPSDPATQHGRAGFSLMNLSAARRATWAPARFRL